LSKRADRKNGNPELLGKIESVRNELNSLVGTEGMESERVLELSRNLDRILLEYYGEMPLGRSI